LTSLKTSRDLFLNAIYFSDFCVLVQAVRQVPSPPDFQSGKDAMDAAKDQAKQKAKEMSKKVPKPPSGRR